MGCLLTGNDCAFLEVAACPCAQTDGDGVASCRCPGYRCLLTSIDHEARWEREGIGTEGLLRRNQGKQGARDIKE